jgi:hypothetical protein
MPLPVEDREAAGSEPDTDDDEAFEQALVEDPLVAGSGRLFEEFLLAGLEGQRDVGDAVGDDVQPQDLRGEQGSGQSSASAVRMIRTSATPVLSRKKVAMRMLRNAVRPSSTAA